MTVTGRLLDADGKPVADGQVVLVAEYWCRTERPLGIYVHNGLPISFGVTGPFRTDGEGRFQRNGRRSVRRSLRGRSSRTRRPRATVTSRSSIDKWTRTQEITIKLDREHVIRGRLIDTQGQPAAGATVRPIMVSGWVRLERP